MKNCWVIGKFQCEGPLYLLKNVLLKNGYQVFFLKEKDSSLPKPEFILFSGNEEELSLWNKEDGETPILLLTPIIPSSIHFFLHKSIYPFVLIDNNGQMEGMVLGLDQQKRLGNFRKAIRDFSIPFLLLEKTEAFILHYLYHHREAINGQLLEELNQYCLAFHCDGVNILRGLGLDSRIGQVAALPQLLDKKWGSPLLYQLIKEMGGERIVYWNNGADFSTSGMDLVIILNKDERLKQMKVKRWKKYRHLFRQPHIIDCVNLYEPEELAAVGYKYLSLFRYKYLLNGEE